MTTRDRRKEATARTNIKCRHRAPLINGSRTNRRKLERTASYCADSGRGSRKEKVLCLLLTSPTDILDKKDNIVLSALDRAGLKTSIGIYFYRFAADNKPFLKIGECTGPSGITQRFRNGWHAGGTTTRTDTYKKESKRLSPSFYGEIKKISPKNPVYFVFYELHERRSHPKIDEIYAHVSHDQYFQNKTICPERMNGRIGLGEDLVWHKSAFREVASRKFPDGSNYPRAVTKAALKKRPG
jgi:hypothetical protein